MTDGYEEIQCPLSSGVRTNFTTKQGVHGDPITRQDVIEVAVGNREDAGRCQ
jgi:hypothetical protein